MSEAEGVLQEFEPEAEKEAAPQAAPPLYKKGASVNILMKLDRR